jgi:hypothetical protein
MSSPLIWLLVKTRIKTLSKRRGFQGNTGWVISSLFKDNQSRKLYDGEFVSEKITYLYK